MPRSPSVSIGALRTRMRCWQTNRAIPGAKGYATSARPFMAKMRSATNDTNQSEKNYEKKSHHNKEEAEENHLYNDW